MSNRNVLGLVAHNFLRHVNARHGGQFDAACSTCTAHLAHFDSRWASDVLETQRRLEQPNLCRACGTTPAEHDYPLSHSFVPKV